MHTSSRIRCQLKQALLLRLVMRELALTPRRLGPRLDTTNSLGQVVRLSEPEMFDRSARAPDELWMADLTYVGLTTDFVFLAVVLDARSRRVMGYAISHLLDTRLCLAALDAAINLRRPRAGRSPFRPRGINRAVSGP